MRKRVTFGTFVEEGGSAERTSWVVVFPGSNTDHVEVLATLVAVFQVLVLFVHLSEADGAVGVVFEVDFFGLFLACGHSALQSFSQLLI